MRERERKISIKQATCYDCWKDETDPLSFNFISKKHSRKYSPV